MFPDHKISVNDLLHKDLPPQTSALITSNLNSWFSHNPPQIDIDSLTKRPILSNDFLDKLEAVAFKNGSMAHSLLLTNAIMMVEICCH